LNYTR